MYDPLLLLLIAVLAGVVGWLLFWPERGFFWRWQRTQQMTARVLREDALKHLHKCERHHQPATVQSIAGDLQITTNEAADLLATMETRELLRVEGQTIHLTAKGRDSALHILRAHRLWERYLADETGFAESEWHGQADFYEHTLSPAEIDALSAQLGHPTYDPHGDPIPAASGELVLPESQPVTSLAIDQPARIVHLEDEPEAIYAQLVAEGLHPGQEIRLHEHSPQRVRFWAGGDEHVLAPIVAANISVIPLPQEQAIEDSRAERLSSLKPGEHAHVLNISPACRGLERRRLMDLGILPGTTVGAELISPSGDPTAYRVRGALIALRQEQADMINITREKIASERVIPPDTMLEKEIA